MRNNPSRQYLESRRDDINRAIAAGHSSYASIGDFLGCSHTLAAYDIECLDDYGYPTNYQPKVVKRYFEGDAGEALLSKVKESFVELGTVQAVADKYGMSYNAAYEAIRRDGTYDKAGRRKVYYDACYRRVMAASASDSCGSMAALCRELSIVPNTLRRWVTIFQQEGYELPAVILKKDHRFKST